MAKKDETLQALAPLAGRESLAESAYQRIRVAILEGGLEPGTRLSVSELAERLGVSRSPVREAVIRLEREGLASSSSNRGAVVATSNGQDLLDLYDVREVLEGLAARQAAERATDEDRKMLRQLWERHSAAIGRDELDDHVSLDLEFHRRLRQVARNRQTAEILDRLSDQIRLALYATASRPGNPEQAIREHRAILEAVLEGEPGRAETLARAHIARIKESLPTDDDSLEDIA